MSKIEIGTVAPDFVLLDTLEQEVRLSNYRGKKVLLSWHPIAWTGVCTDQMRALEYHYDKFAELNTVPLGLSVDPSACKKAWAAVLSIKNVPLLCDFWPHGEAAKAYDIFIEKYGMSERANIIIDENGIVKWVRVYPIAQLPDINEVFEILKSL